jgi:transcriptional regulator with XRE-family HTH domain
MSYRMTGQRVTAKYASDTAKVRRTAVTLMTVLPATPFGAVIQERRIELGIRQEDLATAAGIKATMIGKIEAGDRFPDVKYIPPIAKKLRIDLAQLSMNYMSHRCPKVYQSLLLEIEEPSLLKKLNALPTSLRSTVIHMIESLYVEEMNPSVKVSRRA